MRKHIYPTSWNFRIFTGLVFPLKSLASLELAQPVLRLAKLFSAKIISREFYGSSSTSGMHRLMQAAMLAVIAMLMAAPQPALAVEPDEMLKDPVLEQRARKLSLGLRCLVCQNQSIDDSNAPLAKDLRILVRERIAKGDSNEQAKQYLVDRYGEFVLLKPRFNMHTFILWLGPFALLATGFFFGYRNWKSRPQTAAAGESGAKQLSADEKQKLAALMKEE